MFDYLRDAIQGHPGARVFSDIGCYTLGALPPYEAINSCVDMGASITMAKGAAEAGVHPAIAVIGDSTFTHSGITGLLDVVEDRSPVTVIISDNLTTGMTGGQTSPAAGRLEQICAGIGVEPDAPSRHRAASVEPPVERGTSEAGAGLQGPVGDHLPAAVHSNRKTAGLDT